MGAEREARVEALEAWAEGLGAAPERRLGQTDLSARATEVEVARLQQHLCGEGQQIATLQRRLREGSKSPWLGESHWF